MKYTINTPNCIKDFEYSGVFKNTCIYREKYIFIF
jgi:hypothetical protein